MVAETKERAPEKQAVLREQIIALATELLDLPLDDVVLAPPHTVLKTSSGKIRRAACRVLYERGELGRQRPIWLQFVYLGLGGWSPTLHRLRRQLAHTLYAFYAWLLVGLLAPAGWVGILLLPKRSWRNSLARWTVRLALFLARLPINVTGLEHVPKSTPCVVVANHASYLDAIVLAAVLPDDFAFVAKSELKDNLFTRLLLNRLGHLFVERFDAPRSVEDTGQITEAVLRGRSVVFFAEGTFVRAPGLRAFRMGAFLVAAETSAPIVPMALRGTRSVLRDGQWLPRRGPIRMTIAPPIVPQGQDWNEALRLRAAARAEILRYCGEPDFMQ